MAFTAFAIFKKQCRELQKDMFPKELLDEVERNAKNCTLNYDENRCGDT